MKSVNVQRTNRTAPTRHVCSRQGRVRTCSSFLFPVVLAAIAMACTTPVGVRKADPTDVTRALTRNVLTTGELSEQTKTLLHLADLDEAYAKRPKEVLDDLHHALVAHIEANSTLTHVGLVMLAELAFDHATKNEDPRYFLSSAVYAWAYLFPSDEDRLPGAFDPGVPLALGIYNRALTQAFTPKGGNRVALKSRMAEASFGTVDVRLDVSSIIRGDYALFDFINVADLEVRGLTNRHRRRGLGAPLAAAVRAIKPDAPRPPYLPKRVRVPCSAVVYFDDIYGQLASGALTAKLQITIAWENDRLKVGGQTIPLELETSSSLALMLTEASPWENELKGFFQGDLATMGTDGLISLEPYHPGRIPIVFVHGTASSSARWANMLNDLSNDPRIRERFQFVMFSYNTGNPISYSAFLLRKSIRDLVSSVDPDGKDEALKKMIVIGHSQGGLLTKLTALDSGMKFWELFSDLSPDEIVLAPESRQTLEGSLIVKPLPGVERVIFISTPHRGSYLAAYGPARWLSSMVRSPANLVNLTVDVISSNPESEALREIGKARGSVSDMSPDSDFLETMVNINVPQNVHAHSIVALKGWNNATTEKDKEKLKSSGSDGVVKYESAHLDDVESEFIVDSDHSCQDHPKVIGEVRRILFEHIGSRDSQLQRFEHD